MFILNIYIYILKAAGYTIGIHAEQPGGAMSVAWHLNQSQ